MFCCQLNKSLHLWNSKVGAFSSASGLELTSWISQFKATICISGWIPLLHVNNNIKYIHFVKKALTWMRPALHNYKILFVKVEVNDTSTNFFSLISDHQFKISYYFLYIFLIMVRLLLVTCTNRLNKGTITDPTNILYDVGWNFYSQLWSFSPQLEPLLPKTIQTLCPKRYQLV